MDELETVDETPREVLASRLIDAWCADKGKQIPWAKAIQIVAIVTKQTDDERDRLLKMGDEDGHCGMCGRGDDTAADAKRYRWLLPIVTAGDECDARTLLVGAALMRGLDGDAAIDAAMAGTA